MSTLLYTRVSIFARALTTFFSILLFMPVLSTAAQVTMAWDPSSPAPEGYRIYQRAEGRAYDLGQPAWTGTGTTATIANLTDNARYYFVARAYSGSDESANSNEITFFYSPPLPTTYTIAVSTGANGAISPGNAVTVKEGDNQSFAISPNSGHHISEVTVDGVSVGAASTYTFNNIVVDHTIAASFAVNTHTISASASGNGRVDPAGSTSVNHGSSKSYTFTPDAGYHVANVKVDGISIGAVTSYTFDNVTSNHSIAATFEADTFTITINAGANGSVSPSDVVEIAYGGSQSFTISANEGFHIEDVQVDGQSVGVMEAYTFTNILGDHSVSVSFTENTLIKLWFEAEDGDLQWPMEIADDQNASAGGCVWVPEGAGSLPSGNAGYAEYQIDVPESGAYAIWGRHLSSNSASDSFMVSIDGQPEIVWHTRPAGQDTWTWDVVSLRAAGDTEYSMAPERCLLAAGRHTLRIAQREDGTKLDRLLITNQTDLTDPDSDSALASIEFGDVQINNAWTRINFKKSFVNPVVVAGPISLKGGDPAVIRIRNVDSTGFEMRIQEWDYLDGGHVVETLSYLAMEEGNYTLADGTKIEAAAIETNAAAAFKPINFNEPFNVTPVVMTTLTSFNEADTVTGRMKQITTGGFQYRMQEQELNAQSHATETLGYIAWEPSSGQVGDITYQVGNSADAVTQKRSTIFFETPLPSPPAILADMQTADGGDTANVRCVSKDGHAVDVLVDEEQSRDAETSHTTEIVGYMVLTR